MTPEETTTCVSTLGKTAGTAQPDHFHGYVTSSPPILSGFVEWADRPTMAWMAHSRPEMATQLISSQKAINRVQCIYDRYPDLTYSGDRIHQGLHQ